jgi:hypothetical protein
MVSLGSGSRSVKWYPIGEEVEYPHVRLIARFEGFLGLRDRGSLESALARSQSGYYFEIHQEGVVPWKSRPRIICS